MAEFGEIFGCHLFSTRLDVCQARSEGGGSDAKRRLQIANET